MNSDCCLSLKGFFFKSNGFQLELWGQLLLLHHLKNPLTFFILSTFVIPRSDGHLLLCVTISEQSNLKNKAVQKCSWCERRLMIYLIYIYVIVWLALHWHKATGLCANPVTMTLSRYAPEVCAGGEMIFFWQRKKKKISKVLVDDCRTLKELLLYGLNMGSRHCANIPVLTDASG